MHCLHGEIYEIWEQLADLLGYLPEELYEREGRFYTSEQEATKLLEHLHLVEYAAVCLRDELAKILPTELLFEMHPIGKKIIDDIEKSEDE